MLAFLFAVFGIFLILFGAPIVTSILVSIASTGIATQFELFTFYDITQWIIKNSFNYGTFAIALFIISGNLMTKGKITEKIFNIFTYYLGKKNGFMPIIGILTCLFYGAISGSGPATVAAVAAMIFPMLIEFGYEKNFSAALLMCAGSLGMVIPPSLPLMFYGMITEQDMSSLFKVSLVIGLTIGFLLIIYAYIYSKKHPIDQDKVDSMVDELRKNKFSDLLKDSIWALLMPFVILGGIFTNVLSTTETATISVIYTLIVSIYIYKSLDYKTALETIRESLPIAAGLSIMLSVAYSFSNAIAALNGPQIIGEYVTSTFKSPTLLFIAILTAFFIMGMFMDGGATLGILTPILFPIIMSIGINPIIFGCDIILVIALGLCTPPFGLSLFVVTPMAESSVADITKEAIPLIIIMLITVFVFAIFPNLALWII